MQVPGIYVSQAMAAVVEAINNSAAQPVSSSGGSSAGQPADNKAWRWAEAQIIAVPRKRNKEESLAAYQDFKERFFNLPDQKSKDPRKKEAV